jgi:hypothetical protein
MSARNPQRAQHADGAAGPTHGTNSRPAMIFPSLRNPGGGANRAVVFFAKNVASEHRLAVEYWYRTNI